MTSTPRHKLGRFQIRTLLLAFVVVATVTHVFLQPKPKQQTMGGTLLIESFFQALAIVQSGSSTNSPPPPIENGRWRLRTRTGRLLAEGAHRRGVAQGRWRYYNAAGQCISSGECDDGLLVGRWTTWHDSGHKRCEAEFATSAQRPPQTFVPQRMAVVNGTRPSGSAQQLVSTGLRRGNRRHGTVIWWDESGKVEQREEFRDDVRSVPEKVVSDELPAILDLSLPARTHRDRCTAIRRLQHQGAAGVPLLLSILSDGNPALQRRVLAALEAMGPVAAEAVPPVTAMARDTDHPLAIEAAFALMAIDQANRQHWLQTIVEATVERDPTLVNDLSVAIFDRPRAIAADFDPLLSDPRPEVRQLAAAMLLHALEFTTYQVNSDEESSWHAPDFGFGPLRWSTPLDAWPLNDRDFHEIAERVVDVLERLEHDRDTKLQTAVAEALELIRSRKRLSGSHIHSGGFF
jgi:hypothetical protein